jgi:hypothetical protein
MNAAVILFPEVELELSCAVECQHTALAVYLESLRTNTWASSSPYARQNNIMPPWTVQMQKKKAAAAAGK